MELLSLINKWNWQWVRKGGWAILDQALFSGANFILSMLLARWLIPSEYGSYSIGFSIFLFVAGFQNAFLLEPMTIIGPSQHLGHLKDYNAVILRLQLCLSLLVSIVMLLLATVMKMMNNATLGNLFIIISLSSPFILLFWITRRIPYTEQKPSSATLGTLVYMILTISLLLIFRYYNQTLTPGLAYVILALASFIAALALFAALKINLSVDRQTVSALTVTFENWRYGKWIAITSIVYWLSGDIYILLSAGFLGLEEAAALKALQNLVMPLNQIITALGLVLLPWTAGRLHQLSKHKMKKEILSISLIFSIVSVVYLFLLMTFSDTIIRLLYNQQYISYSWLLPYIGLASLITIFGSGYQIGLKSQQKSKAIFISYTVSAIAAITLGTFLIRMLGIKGAGISMICTSVFLILTLHMQWARFSH